MSPARDKSHIENDPEFRADCLNDDLRQREIVAKWGVSAGWVSERRARIREEGIYGARPAGARDAIAAGLEESVWDTETGTGYFTRFRDRPWGEDDWRAFLQEQGTDPDSVVFSFGVTSNPSGGFWNKLQNVRPRRPDEITPDMVPLAEFYRALEERSTDRRVLLQPSRRGLVVVIADSQIGKTGRRGGTPELLQRLAQARVKLEAEIIRRNPSRILYLDGGDGIEGFESGGNPMFTNDLSLPDQIDCYAKEIFTTLDLCHRYAPVEASGVCSNHAAWRHAKQTLGKPSDDWGIHVLKRMQSETEKLGMDIVYHYPDDYDESVCVDFMGTPIGLVHGNQFAPGKAIDWWQGQTFGDQAVTRADVLVTAHHHSFGAGVAGQNPHTKRERMWLGAPTIDSGSDWYRNIKGRDSLPGIMIFEIDEQTGFDLASLAIL